MGGNQTKPTTASHRTIKQKQIAKTVINLNEQKIKDLEYIKILQKKVHIEQLKDKQYDDNLPKLKTKIKDFNKKYNEKIGDYIEDIEYLLTKLKQNSIEQKSKTIGGKSKSKTKKQKPKSKLTK